MRTRIVVMIVAALAAGATATPPGASFADPATSSPNDINNATVDRPLPFDGPSGIYDLEDQYRDSNGFPLPGWQYLTRPPS